MERPPSGPLTAALQRHVDSHEIAGGALRFRQHGELIEDAAVGWADIAGSSPVTARSIFRQASLTKPVIAVAVVQLIEEGAIGLDDEVARFIPSFASTSVALGASADWTSTAVQRELPVVPADRRVTIRDLLTHSSGLGQGPHSEPLVRAASLAHRVLADRVDAYAAIPADAQPGAATGYSPQLGFDILGRVVEVVTGTDLQAALRASIFEPLGMADTRFVLDDEQRTRLVRLYEYADGALRDDSDLADARNMLATPEGLYSGAAGLLGTVADFDRFARMLGGGGELDGARVLGPAGVRLLTTARSTGARRMPPTMEWGLGVIVETVGDEVKAAGSWGWSGAWGSHLVIDPTNDTTLVLMINRSNIGGAGSPISRELERLALLEYGRVGRS